MTHRDVWSLDPDVAHLNHGSFGAAPRRVLEAQEALRRTMERNPMVFMEELYQPALDRARAALAGFVGADPDGLVFVRNATEGVNAVLQSLAPRLEPDANVVLTSHGYGAVTNTIDLVIRLTGASKRVVDVPFPVRSSQAAIDAVLDAVDGSTALVVVDHVTSPTGLVLDISPIIEGCEPDVPVLVDGAHAPGMLPLDVAALGASFYVGNCHKWLCAPKGAGMLWVAERYRDMMRPAVASHGMSDRYPHPGPRLHARFDWTGTDDRTAWLVVPEAIETMAALSPDGWPGVMRANHELALAGRAILNRRLGLAEAAPETMIGALAALVPLRHPDPPGLKRRMRHDHGIEFAMSQWHDETIVIRVSAQRYNSIDEYERFAEALVPELGTLS